MIAVGWSAASAEETDTRAKTVATKKQMRICHSLAHGAEAPADFLSHHVHD
jgi:hypothetical protein